MATVMLDAGHGGFDNGAMFNGRKEKDDNLSLTLKVGQYLENRGVNVIYTRTEDIYQNPNQKAGIANRSDADYFVSIQALSLIHIQVFRRLYIRQRVYLLLWQRI